MPTGTSKLVFANQLRGLAAVCVAGSHLVGVFWAMRDVVSLVTATPLLEGAPPAILRLFSLPWLNFGPFGVGIFFLISGLVIPISLEQHTRGTFLLARLLRIYPTYIIALLLEVALLHVDAAYWGKLFPYDNWTIISNALLIYNMVGQPSIDLVNWTLCIELKFYLGMMVLAPQIRRGSAPTLLLVGCGLLAANLVLTWHPLLAGRWLQDLAGQLTIESTFIIFMLIGVLFNFRLRGLLQFPSFVASCAVMIALFLASWLHSIIYNQVPIVTINYFYALGLFTVLFLLRRYARPVRIIDFMASISFPFYLIHSLVGYSVLKVLIVRLGLSYGSAVCMAVAVSISLATILHKTIESPSIALGRRCASKRKQAAI